MAWLTAYKRKHKNLRQVKTNIDIMSCGHKRKIDRRTYTCVCVFILESCHVLSRPIYYTTTCFHLQVIFFTNQLTIYSLYLVFFKLIILKL